MGRRGVRAKLGGKLADPHFYENGAARDIVGRLQRQYAEAGGASERAEWLWMRPGRTARRASRALSRAISGRPDVTTTEPGLSGRCGL